MMNGIVFIFFFSVLCNSSVFAMERKLSKPKSSKIIPIPSNADRGRRRRNSSDVPKELGDPKLLMQAIKAGDSVAFEASLKKEIDLNVCDKDGNTPLTSAIFMGNFAMVQRLLAEGSSLNPAHGNPMWIARLMGNEKIIQLLKMYAVKAGMSVNTGSKCSVERYEYHECACKACIRRLQLEREQDSAVRTNQDLRELNTIDALTPEQVAKINADRAQRIKDLVLVRATRSKLRNFLHIDDQVITTDSARIDVAAQFESLMRKL